MTEQRRTRPRGYDNEATRQHYAQQAQRDFAMYAQAEANDANKKNRPVPVVTGYGAGKLAILQVAREHPQMRCADVARLASVHYQYAWKVLKRVRGRG